MKTLKYSLLLFVLLVSMLCKKKPLPDILPPLTTSGENTIGCLINGEVFVPTIRRFIGPDNICEKTRLNDFPLYPTYFFMFSACRAVAISDTVNDARIRIKVNNVRNTCDYNIYKAIVTYNKNNYYCDSLRGGVINIVYLDTINKIISGTFYFDAINTDTKDVIYITDGRFDLKEE